VDALIGIFEQLKRANQLKENELNIIGALAKNAIGLKDGK
jgi:hypothetical protein